MSERITIDPVTRIEGHLRVDVTVDKGQIVDAWSSGQMFRGIEKILEDKHPNDAWFIAQRICGVCTTVHAIASVRAVENALKLPIPLNAQYIRNLMLIFHAMHDHIVHFYQLSALDWVDVVSALSADVDKTATLAQSISDWHRNSKQEFQGVKEKVKAFVDKGRLGVFANGYWGHPAMKLPPEVNLLAVSHYLQALEYQRFATQACTILSGKNPHIQNLTVGGVTTAINPDDDSTLNMEKLYNIKTLIQKTQEFIQKVYFPDVAAIASFYPDWLSIGGGVDNYLSVPDLPLDTDGNQFEFTGGTIQKNDLGSLKPITTFQDKYFSENVSESIAHSWYDGSWTKHPWEEDTIPKYSDFDPEGNYSWIKSPRFKINNSLHAFQVGPVSHILTGLASKNPLTLKWANAFLAKVPKEVQKPTILLSTLGRHAARAIRAAMFSDLALKHWKLLVDNIGKGDYSIANPAVYPKEEIKGVGMHEAPRGVLSHWVTIKNGKIKKYQAVVPSTWNAGPRDSLNKRGPYEESLIGNPIADSKKPLEAIRTIHSFDPCIACAVQMFDPNQNKISTIKVL